MREGEHFYLTASPRRFSSTLLLLTFLINATLNVILHINPFKISFFMAMVHIYIFFLKARFMQPNQYVIRYVSLLMYIFIIKTVQDKLFT